MGAFVFDKGTQNKWEVILVAVLPMVWVISQRLRNSVIYNWLVHCFTTCFDIIATCNAVLIALQLASDEGLSLGLLFANLALSGIVAVILLQFQSFRLNKLKINGDFLKLGAPSDCEVLLSQFYKGVER